MYWSSFSVSLLRKELFVVIALGVTCEEESCLTTNEWKGYKDVKMKTIRNCLFISGVENFLTWAAEQVSYPSSLKFRSMYSFIMTFSYMLCLENFS